MAQAWRQKGLRQPWRRGSTPPPSTCPRPTPVGRRTSRLPCTGRGPSIRCDVAHDLTLSETICRARRCHRRARVTGPAGKHTSRLPCTVRGWSEQFAMMSHTIAHSPKWFVLHASEHAHGCSEASAGATARRRLRAGALLVQTRAISCCTCGIALV